VMWTCVHNDVLNKYNEVQLPNFMQKTPFRGPIVPQNQFFVTFSNHITDRVINKVQSGNTSVLKNSTQNFL